MGRTRQMIIREFTWHSRVFTTHEYLYCHFLKKLACWLADMSDCCFSFMNSCLIWCAEARAGTEFCKPLDQAHMYFHAAVISNYRSCLIFDCYLTCKCFFGWLRLLLTLHTCHGVADLHGVSHATRYASKSSVHQDKMFIS